MFKKSSSLLFFTALIFAGWSLATPVAPPTTPPKIAPTRPLVRPHAPVPPKKIPSPPSRPPKVPPKPYHGPPVPPTQPKPTPTPPSSTSSTPLSVPPPLVLPSQKTPPPKPAEQIMPPAASTTPPPGLLTQARSCPGSYTLIKGDSLNALAKRFGLTVTQLMRANHLHTMTLNPGTRLLLPKQKSLTLEYTVLKGDTLAGLADRFQLSAQEIVKDNGLGLRTTLKPSERLKLVFTAGCRPLPVAAQGLASWYGPGYGGKITASGEPYRLLALTAASRTLPFGSVAQVDNLKTGKSVLVLINDYGPGVQGRTIDLSYAAAKALGMVRAGLAKVKIILVHTPPASFSMTQRP